MRKLSALLLFTALCGSMTLPSALVSAQRSSASFAVVVVFNDYASLDGFSYRPDDRARANAAAWNYLDRGVAGAVQALEAQHGFRADHVYSAALRGFAARLTAQQIRDLENDPAVAYVEPDGTMTANAQTLPWGIDKIDADLSSTVAGNGSGAITNVNSYVIDTGVDTAHTDLNVVGHVNFAGGPNTDCHGHGTHVAGTVAARDNTQDVVGVAPGAPTTGVKVLGCGGTGSNSNVIKGIDWVTANARKPAVANMSLGGGASQAVDDAVVRSANSGVFYVLAAGNDGADACNSSPARAGAGTNNGIMTVAATDSADKEASWSNYGKCVDIWAPGGPQERGHDDGQQEQGRADDHSGERGHFLTPPHPACVSEGPTRAVGPSPFMACAPPFCVSCFSPPRC
ncbi:MAG: S8 family peptidase [Acidobacteria bacterium]|nr:S8 family peptidase [Acidobacteriota bacterium]